MPWVEDPTAAQAGAAASSGAVAPLARPRAWRRYAFAVAVALLALLLSRLLGGFLEPTRLLLLFPAIVAAAWYGGFLPGALTALIATVGADYLLIEPVGSVALGAPEEYLRLGIFVLVALGIASLTEAQRHALLRAETAAAAAQEATAELAAQKQRTDLVLRSVSDGITVQDAQGRLTYANDAAARMVGLPDAATLAATPPAQVLRDFELLDEEGRPFPLEELPGRRALQGHEGVERLVRYRRRDDGSEHWSLVRANPVRDGSGNVLFAVNVFHDLTERIANQRSLEENARRLEHLARRLEGALERITALQEVTAALSEARTPEEVAAAVVERGVRALGAQAAVLVLASGDSDASMELCRAHGLADDLARRWHRLRPDDPIPLARAIRERRPLFIDPAEDPAEDLPGLADADHDRLGPSIAALPLLVGERVMGGLAFGLPDGRTLDDDARELALALSRQAALALERAHLFEAERTARAEAEAASSAKSRFLAVMSHELRTPLNAILGYQQLLEEGVVGPVNERQKAQLGRIRASTRHLLGLIEEILSLSRIEAGREEVRPEEVDLALLVQEASSLIAPLADGQGLELRVHCELGENGWLSTDPDKVRQILLNLLSNAIKFTERGGVEVTARAGGGIARVQVQDTGVGIGPQDLERIFEPFVQADGAGGRRAEGTGLGLAVSRQLAELLGGRLDVASEPGRGSTFTLELPLGT